MPPETVVSSSPILHTHTDRPLLVACSAPGCVTLTMGGTCVEHDVPVVVDFPRGRPYPSPSARTVLADAAA
jgi:hypothetical protein